MAASSSTAAASKATVGILSIGDMGMSVAKLLLAHNYSVCTTATGRSQHTIDRIKAARIQNLPSEVALLVESDIVLSIVPPRDAVATARRIHEAARTASRERLKAKGPTGLLYIDLNAISPKTTQSISAFFTQAQEPSTPSITRRLSRTLSMKSNEEPPPPPPVAISYLDGGIIGAPPSQKEDKSWNKPSLILSGPIDDLLTEDLQTVLNTKHVSDKIGTASTLKATFAAVSKGTVALATAAFTTASAAGVLPELQAELKRLYPPLYEFCARGVTIMPPKAYRLVDEMKQIGETMADEGHLGPGLGGQAALEGISEIHRMIADDTVLGKEMTHKRKRGTTVEDVAEAVQAGLREKRLKKDQKAEVEWRGSWT